MLCWDSGSLETPSSGTESETKTDTDGPSLHCPVGVVHPGDQRAVGAINAESDSINDAGTNATYNESDGEVTLYVKNVGGGPLEPEAAEILLNGVYVQPSGAVVDSERDQWRVGTVLELTITVEEPLEAGEHRAVVEIESARAILTFDVE